MVRGGTPGTGLSGTDMATLLIFSLVILGLLMLGVMLHGALTGRVELLTARNLVFASFLVFQIISGVVTLLGHVPRNFGTPVGDMEGNAVEYVLWAWAVVLLFMLAYRLRPGVDWVAARLPRANAVPAEPVMWGFVVVLLIVALAMRVGIRIPAVGVLASMIGAALAASAGGLAAWIWLRRPWNPLAIMYFLAALAAACLIAQIGTSGRRNVLCVLLCAGWVVYYTSWIYLKPAAIMTRAAIAAVPAVIFLAALSTVRHSQGGNAVEVARSLFTAADLRRGVTELVYGQEAAYNSIWLIENIPERFPQRPLQGGVMILLSPVPRMIWAQKPEALGSTFVDMARVRGVPGGYSVGPGIVGHIVHDGGLYALLVYAACGGLYVALIDRASLAHRDSPFMLAALGAGLGHLAGMPRGDITVFGWLALLGLVAPVCAMVIISKTLLGLGFAAPVQVGAEEDDADAPEHGDASSEFHEPVI